MNSITKKKAVKIAAYFLSILIFILLWEVLSLIVKSSLILPYPLDVVKRIGSISIEFEFWKSFFYTFCRVLVSVVMAIVAGTLLGILSGSFKFFEDFLYIPGVIIRSTPIIAIILIALFWFNSTQLPVFVSLIMTLPVMSASVRTGIKSTPQEKIFFAKCHNFNFMQILFYIKWPSAKADFWNGVSQIYSLTWKIVIAGEVMCIPRFALGSILQRSQIHLETQDVLACTLIMIFFSFITSLMLKILISRVILKIKR